MADFSVDPAALTSAAGSFRTARDDLSSALGALFTALADTGGMAGADTPGAQFSASYDEVAAAVETTIRKCVTGLGSIGDGLDTQSVNYRGSDAGSVFHHGEPG